MAKEKRSMGGQIAARIGAKGAAVIAVFLFGLLLGATSCGGGDDGGLDRDQVHRCLPAQSAAQLEQCLGGGR